MKINIEINDMELQEEVTRIIATTTWSSERN